MWPWLRGDQTQDACTEIPTSDVMIGESEWIGRISADPIKTEDMELQKDKTV
jgi:hypothetical protein